MKTLFETLEEAQKYKFLGPLPIENHIKNGEGFLEVLTGLSLNVNSPIRLVDIGSGGGIPALVIAEKYPHWNFLLVERKAKRASFLSWAVENTEFGAEIFQNFLINNAVFTFFKNIFFYVNFFFLYRWASFFF